MTAPVSQHVCFGYAGIFRRGLAESLTSSLCATVSWAYRKTGPERENRAGQLHFSGAVWRIAVRYLCQEKRPARLGENRPGHRKSRPARKGKTGPVNYIYPARSGG